MKFSYTGLDTATLPREERPCYVHFTVADEGGNLVLDFYTNKNLDGYFTQFKDGTYHQLCGTCQFSLPLSKSGIRKALRRMALEKLECRY